MNILKAIGHGIAVVAIFAIPLIINSHAQVLDLSISGILSLIYNELRVSSVVASVKAGTYK